MSTNTSKKLDFDLLFSQYLPVLHDWQLQMYDPAVLPIDWHWDPLLHWLLQQESTFFRKKMILKHKTSKLKHISYMFDNLYPNSKKDSYRYMSNRFQLQYKCHHLDTDKVNMHLNLIRIALFLIFLFLKEWFLIQIWQFFPL